MLETYTKKRNFKKTSEPSGKKKSSARGALTFVIQKHSASRLHYDFRLECAGVLLSWAVPKGPSLDPGVKRLAVAVEDHPLAYGDFEGIIPAGQYGGGEVIVWDRGTYCPDNAIDTNLSRKDQEKEIQKGLKKGKLSFTLAGKKLHGSWTLVRTQRSEKDWLLIKHTDEFVDTRHDITDEEGSVLSQKTIASLEKTNPDKKKKDPEKGRKTTKPVKKERLMIDKKRSGRTTASIGIKPMLATLASGPFDKAGWIYEPKFDGIRALAYIHNGNVQLSSRSGLDLNHRFPLLVSALSKNKDMVIDGEIVALDAKGHPSFQLLQSRDMRSRSSSGLSAHIFYYVFDMLANGQDILLDESLHKRKSLLKKNLTTATNVKYVDDLHCDGETAFELCLDKGLEGIVAKRLDAPYQAGRRSPDWLKVKAVQSAEFVICGYTQGTGSRERTFGSLLLGHYKNKELRYAGGVGTGFDQDMIKLLLGKLKPLVRKTSPFKDLVKDKGRPVWVEPKLVAEIKYAQWTSDGRLRIPVFMRLRQDVAVKETGPPNEVDAPKPRTSTNASAKTVAKTAARKVAKTSAKKSPQKMLNAKEKMKKSTGQKRATKSAPVKAKKEGAGHAAAVKEGDIAEALMQGGDALKIEVGGYALSFSHLNKELWPGKNGKALTKRDYASYLLTVAPYILPHLKDRPLTLVRFPDGVKGQRFFQKHWEKNLPPFVDTFEHFAEHSDENHRFLLCNNLATLLWLAQIADLELHTSHARIGKAAENKKLTQTYTNSVERIERSTLNYPDYLVLDLDPYIYSGKEAKGEEPALNKKAFDKVCRMALVLREMLAEMRIQSFVKTSGRTGLHIYVPIVRNIDYDQVRSVAGTLGKHLLSLHPKDVTMDWAVVKRTGKIFFDHNMNARTKTLASIYSPRMSQTGTVSVPVDWDELSSIYPEEFTLRTVPGRLADKGDLWQDILITNQT